MRHIPKPERGEEPAQFSRWKRGHPGAKYSSLHNIRVKSALKESFIKRQKYLCCYCETRVSFDNSHIEHIEPQLGGLSEKTLEYSNMAVSCIKDPKKFENPDDPSGIGIVRDGWLHCGHARGTLPAVSPYDERCERLFAYSFSGEIKVNPELGDPEEIRLAQETIDNLRLNVPTLVSLRNLVMFECVKALDRGVSAEAILREINGRLPPFVSSAAAAAAAFASNRNL